MVYGAYETICPVQLIETYSDLTRSNGQYRSWHRFWGAGRARDTAIGGDYRTRQLVWSSPGYDTSRHFAASHERVHGLQLRSRTHRAEVPLTVAAGLRAVMMPLNRTRHSRLSLCTNLRRSMRPMRSLNCMVRAHCKTDIAVWKYSIMRA